MTRHRHLAILAVLLVGSGCATTLSTLQTGKVLEPKQVRVTVGSGAYIPAGTIFRVIDTGIKLGEKGKTAIIKQTPGFAWTAEDEQNLVTSGIALAALPPSAQFELGLRVGLFRNFDAGLRYSSNAIRLDGRYQLFHLGDDLNPDGTRRPSPKDFKARNFGEGGRSTDIALGVGVSKYLFSSKVLDVLQYVEMGDFSRWDVDATLYVSHDFIKYFGLYVAPKYVWSTTSFDETLVRVSEVANQVVETRCNNTDSVCPDVSLPDKVDMHFVGATAGLRAGIPAISVYLELTAGNTFATARILGVDRQLGGLTLYPAGGLVGTF